MSVICKHLFIKLLYLFSTGCCFGNYYLCISNKGEGRNPLSITYLTLGIHWPLALSLLFVSHLRCSLKKKKKQLLTRNWPALLKVSLIYVVVQFYPWFKFYFPLFLRLNLWRSIWISGKFSRSVGWSVWCKLLLEYCWVAHMVPSTSAHFWNSAQRKTYSGI